MCGRRLLRVPPWLLLLIVVVLMWLLVRLGAIAFRCFGRGRREREGFGGSCRLVSVVCVSACAEGAEERESEVMVARLGVCEGPSSARVET